MPSTTPSLSVDDQIHLGRDSTIWRVFEIPASPPQVLPLIWDDTLGNQAVGLEALGTLQDLEDGSQNTALGRGALQNLAGGSNNTALGSRALESLVRASSNTVLGRRALFNLEAGSGNIAIGESAGEDLFDSLIDTRDNNIYIGNDGATFDTGTIRIGSQDRNGYSFLAGRLGLGFTNADDEGVPPEARGLPAAQLVVRASRDGTASNEVDNVVWFENIDTAGGGDVLALKIGEPSPLESGNNFITFLDGNNTSLGAIEGNGAGGVTTASSGNDYAEFLERIDPAEELGPGDVVGVFGDRISASTRNADRVMVISTAPIVLGNDPGDENRERFERVAFVGQAQVRIEGPVHIGDLLVASGRDDGTARAVAATELALDELLQVLGRALESSAEGGEKRVRALVGLPDLKLLGSVLRTWETALLARLDERQAPTSRERPSDSRTP